MVEIHTHVRHELGCVNALERLHQLVDSLDEKFPQQVHQVRTSWQGNKLNIRFAAYGYLVQWEALVQETQVLLLGQIPDAARSFKGKIEQAIVARLESALGAAQSTLATPSRHSHTADSQSSIVFRLLRMPFACTFSPYGQNYAIAPLSIEGGWHQLESQLKSAFTTAEVGGTYRVSSSRV